MFVQGDLYFFARGQICSPRADLPAPIWRDHFFTINQRLMEMETCFPETRFCFRHSLKWNCNVDGNGNMFPKNKFPFPSFLETEL